MEHTERYNKSLAGIAKMLGGLVLLVLLAVVMIRAWPELM